MVTAHNTRTMTLGMLILAKIFLIWQFCIPHLRTPQPVLQYYVPLLKSRCFHILHHHKPISPKLLEILDMQYQTLIFQFFGDQNHLTSGINVDHNNKNSIQYNDT